MQKRADSIAIETQTQTLANALRRLVRGLAVGGTLNLGCTTATRVLFRARQCDYKRALALWDSPEPKSMSLQTRVNRKEHSS